MIYQNFDFGVENSRVKFVYQFFSGFPHHRSPAGLPLVLCEQTHDEGYGLRKRTAYFHDVITIFIENSAAREPEPSFSGHHEQEAWFIARC